MNFLELVINYLQTKFPEDWINSPSFDFADPNIATQQVSVLMSEATLYVTDNYNYSILSGEYVKYKDTKGKIDEIIKLLKIIGSGININGSESDENLSNLNQTIFYQISEFFVKPLIHISIRYKALCHTIDRKLNKRKVGSVLFDRFKDEPLKGEADQSLNPEIFDKIKIIQFSIDLTGIDFNLTVSEKALARCLFIQHDLSNSLIPSNDSFQKVLFNKANYLIYKILYRYDQDEKNYLYAYNFSDTEIDKNELNVGIFDDFKLITENHYDDRKIKSKFTNKRVQSFYEKIDTGKVPSFSDYHAVIKHYKDDKNSLEQLKNLTATYISFCDEYQQKTDIVSYNKRAALITKHYILNNELSLKIEKGEINLTNWEIEFEKFKLLSFENNIHNFFPYYKLAILLSNGIEKQLKSENPDLLNTRPLIGKFEEVIKELYRAYDWCVENRFIAFMLPFEESVIKKQAFSFEIFLHSTFVLPLNYPRIKNEIEEIKSNIQKFKTTLDIHENLTLQKSAIKDVKEHIDKTEKRSIEILSIFSAIVLFVLGDIQIFSEVNDLSRAFQFMVAFAYALCLFVLLVWLISRPEGFKIKGLTQFQKFVIAFYIIGTIGMFFIINNLPPFEKPYQNEQIEALKKALDSTRIVVDSLNKKVH